MNPAIFVKIGRLAKMHMECSKNWPSGEHKLDFRQNCKVEKYMTSFIQKQIAKQTNNGVFVDTY